MHERLHVRANVSSVFVILAYACCSEIQGAVNKMLRETVKEAYKHLRLLSVKSLKETVSIDCFNCFPYADVELCIQHISSWNRGATTSVLM